MSTQNEETGNSETKNGKSQKFRKFLVVALPYVVCILLAIVAYCIYKSLVSDHEKLVDYQKYYNFISVGIMAIYGFAVSFIAFKSKGAGRPRFLSSMKIHIGVSTLLLGLVMQCLSFNMSNELSDYQRGKLTDAIVNTITDTVKSQAKNISEEVQGVDSTNTENTSKVVTYIDSMTQSANKRDSTLSEMVDQVLTKSLDSLNNTIKTHQENVGNTNAALELLKSSIESTNVETAETNRKLQTNAEQTAANLAGVTERLEDINDFNKTLSNSFLKREDKVIKILEKVDQTFNKILQTEEDSANVADSVTDVAKLRTSIDSLNGEFRKMDRSLKKTVLNIREQRDIMLAVRVFVGTEKALKDPGYLSTPRFMLLFRKNYKIQNFPDTTNSKVKTVYIGEPFPVSGELVALCNYDGKLHEGKDYTVSKGQSDTTHVVFSRPLIAGQPILAVLKD